MNRDVDQKQISPAQQNRWFTPSTNVRLWQSGMTRSPVGNGIRAPWSHLKFGRNGWALSNKPSVDPVHQIACGSYHGAIPSPKLRTSSFYRHRRHPSVITFLALYHIPPVRYIAIDPKVCPGKRYIKCTGFTPLVSKIWPHGQVIISTSLRLDVCTSHIRRQINLGCPHHTHGHAYKATGYPEVSMLTGSLAATVIVF
jgi:hypothetical protein